MKHAYTTMLVEGDTPIDATKVNANGPVGMLSLGDGSVALHFRDVATVERVVAQLQDIGNWLARAPVGNFPREHCHTDGCEGKPEDRSMYCPECTAELLKQIPF